MIEDLDTGTEARIEIECSTQTRRAFKRVLADVDPDMTYEELLIAVIRLHEDNPGRIEKHHY